jgi:hypothetical protein
MGFSMLKGVHRSLCQKSDADRRAPAYSAVRPIADILSPKSAAATAPGNRRLPSSRCSASHGEEGAFGSKHASRGE